MVSGTSPHCQQASITGISLSDRATTITLDFLSNGKKIRRPGYVTNIIADMAIDWMENKRDKNKPFCLLMHNKAPHRVWNPDTCDLRLYDDVTYPLPKTFYDDYAGRLAAQKQKMSIIKDMDLVYDNKMGG